MKQPTVVWPQALTRARFVCEVPRALGPVTAMSVEGSKVRVETKSGIDLIVTENGIEAVHILER